ncbi:hypothetical protein R3P38DRAFT_3419781 [Favolaschia claudopus]|uniref:Uncharacterized protein n=1 Tax=Favolaschia claudopus TaxID=2862362 RepID=A0AAW0EH62_9AGAR
MYEAEDAHRTKSPQRLWRSYAATTDCETLSHRNEITNARRELERAGCGVQRNCQAPRLATSACQRAEGVRRRSSVSEDGLGKIALEKSAKHRLPFQKDVCILQGTSVTAARERIGERHKVRRRVNHAKGRVVDGVFPLYILGPVLEEVGESKTAIRAQRRDVRHSSPHFCVKAFEPAAIPACRFSRDPDPFETNLEGAADAEETTEDGVEGSKEVVFGLHFQRRQSGEGGLAIEEDVDDCKRRSRLQRLLYAANPRECDDEGCEYGD